MKNKRIYSFLILFAVCIVTAFSFLKGSAVSSQKNEIKTNPDTEYQITYELNGGRFEGEYPKTFKISKETAIPNPIKDGSEFLGWTINDKTDAKPVKDYKIPAMTKEDVKLTANWKNRGNMLYQGESFRSTINYIISRANPSNYKKIVFDYGKPKANGSDVSVSQNKSIIAYGEGDTVYIVSEEEIFANENCFKMFENFNYIESIEFNNFNTSKVTSMSSMFIRCVELESIKGIETFDTSNVTSADFTFFSCVKLKTLDVSNWDTSKLKTTYHMFSDCSILQSLDVSKWNINNVTNMSYMFASSNSLKEIKGIEKWDTSQVTDMSWMFNMCYNLDGEITIMNPNLRDYRAMFWACSNAKNSNSKFIVKYISPETKEVARKIVADKMEQDRVFLYEEPSALVNGQTFNSKIKGMVGVDNVEEIQFVYGTNANGVDVSEAQDGSIKAHIEGAVLTVACEGEIIANADCYQMFYRNKYTKIEFKNFNTSQVTNMSYMFYDCSSLTEIKGLETWDTSNVTNMQNMFGINALINLDVSKFDTSKVIYMNSMFEGSPSLTNIIGLENFDTSQVTNMDYMLDDCPYLSGSITIMNPNITDYRGMFKITATDSSAKFVVKYTDDVTKEVARQMVATKSSNSNVFLYEPPTLVDGQTFNSTISRMSGFANVTEMRFAYGTPNTSGTDVSEAQDGSIKAYISGTVLTVSSESEIMANPNSNCMFLAFGNTGTGVNKVLNKIIFENFNTSQVTNMNGMFSMCCLIKNLDISNWDTSQVTDMANMFEHCQSLTSLDISNWKMSNVTDIHYMFYNCNSLTNLDISGWDTGKVTNTSQMFQNCRLLQSLNLSNWDTSSVTNMNYMFSDCNSLTNLDTTNFNTNNVTTMSFMFNNCSSLPSLNLSNWDTSQIENMTYMFNGCTNLSGEITIKNPYMKSYTGMFTNCSTISPAKFVINYTDSNTKLIAQYLLNTKSYNSNIMLGTEVGAISDIPNDEEASVPDTVVLTIKDGNKTTTKEIVIGEIGSLNTPSKEGMIFSGYFYDAEFTKPVSERGIISEDTTIYIKWEEVPQEENKDESLEVA